MPEGEKLAKKMAQEPAKELLPSKIVANRRRINLGLNFETQRMIGLIDEVRAKGPECPAAVANAAMRFKQDRIRLIGKCLDNIAGYSGPGVKEAFQVLGEEKIAKVFASHPYEFAMMAKIFGEGACISFGMVRDAKISSLFAISPWYVRNNLDKLDKAIGKEGREHLQSLINGKLKDFFASDPLKAVSYFSEIIDSSGKGCDKVLEALEGKDVADSFMEYPDRFVEIAKAAGQDSGEAFKALGRKIKSGSFFDFDAYVEAYKKGKAKVAMGK